MKLFFDTETTGKYPETARLVQLGVVLVDDDLCERAVVDVLVRPEDFEIPAEVTAIHGISHETALAAGIPLKVVLALFSNLCRLADEAIAHNLHYDKTVLGCEFRRVRQDLEAVFPKKTTCTMLEATPVCKIPNPYRDEWKWPKLIEAHQHLLGEGFEGAHSALMDVRACMRVYGKLRTIEKTS